MKYIVVLSDKIYVKNFIDYLTQNNIVIDFKEEEALIFIIITDENSAKLIEALNYVKVIVKDRSFKLDIEEPKQKNVEESILQQQVDYANWGVNRVLAPCMWERGITGKGINVAVLDSGVGPHVDLVVSGNVSFTGEPPQNGYWHGTHVAGIIAARGFSSNHVGVAYDVNLFNVKVINNNNIFYTSTLVSGITWCGNNNIQIANMSLGYFAIVPDPATMAAVQAALDFSMSKGCIFVASSGNDGVSTVGYPGAAKGVISVGAIDQNNLRANFPNWGSNYGAGLGYVAPGVDIDSTVPNNGYAEASGTSMAAPHVTAMIALLLSEDPLRTQAQIEEILTKAALDLGNPGYDIEYGNGLIRSPRFPMTLIVNPSQDIYDCEKNGFIDIFAYDSLGRPIDEAPLNIAIVTPSGNVIDIFGKETDSNGKFTLEVLFNCCHCNPNPTGLIELNEIGSYFIKVEANPTCSLSAIVETSFNVLECELHAFVDTNKNSYLFIDNGVVIGAVKDDNGKLVKNADVMFIITSPSNEKIVVENITNEFGLAYFNFQIDCPGAFPIDTNPTLTEVGTYTVEMRATKTCNIEALAITSFEVLKEKLIGNVLIKHKICTNSTEELRIEVRDGFNRKVSNANVELTILSPLNEVALFGLITNEDGYASIKIVTNKNCHHKSYTDTYFAQVCGEYIVQATISKDPCYEITVVKGEFKVKSCACK